MEIGTKRVSIKSRILRSADIKIARDIQFNFSMHELLLD